MCGRTTKGRNGEKRCVFFNGKLEFSSDFRAYSVIIGEPERRINKSLEKLLYNI